VQAALICFCIVADERRTVLKHGGERGFLYRTHLEFNTGYGCDIINGYWLIAFPLAHLTNKSYPSNKCHPVLELSASKN
jgi:hypothetical protein